VENGDRTIGYTIRYQGQTLLRIKDVIKTAIVPDVIVVKYESWVRDKSRILNILDTKLTAPFVVRSSHSSEDTLNHSAAEKHKCETVLNGMKIIDHLKQAISVDNVSELIGITGYLSENLKSYFDSYIFNPH